MLQIAVCEHTDANGALADLVEQYAAGCGVDVAPLIRDLPPLNLIERIANPGQEPPVDVLVSDCRLPGFSGMELLREARNASPGLCLVLMADSDEAAYEAISQGVRGFAVKPVTAQSVAGALDQVVPQMARCYGASLVLRFRDCVRRVNPHEIVYVETSGHDQVVHLRDGSSHAMRSSSQALFDQLSHDCRFFKNGSSYIVNLAHVRSLSSEGFAALSDGSTVSVPVRLRKPFEEALFAHSGKA